MKANSLATILSVPEASVKTIRRTLSPGLHRYVAIVADTPTAVTSGQPASQSRDILPIAVVGDERLLWGQHRKGTRNRSSHRFAVGPPNSAEPASHLSLPASRFAALTAAPPLYSRRASRWPVVGPLARHVIRDVEDLLGKRERYPRAPSPRACSCGESPSALLDQMGDHRCNQPHA